MGETVKFDPDRVDHPEYFGYPGVYPKTPCKGCGSEYFNWIGDWNLGYMCVECRKAWRSND